MGVGGLGEQTNADAPRKPQACEAGGKYLFLVGGSGCARAALIFYGSWVDFTVLTVRCCGQQPPPPPQHA